MFSDFIVFCFIHYNQELAAKNISKVTNFVSSWNQNQTLIQSIGDVLRVSAPTVLCAEYKTNNRSITSCK